MEFFKNEDLINQDGTVSRKTIKTVMETRNQVEEIVYNKLNQMKEGITDFVFHTIEKQTDDFLTVTVSYTWSFNGHKKRVENIERMFYKENNIWKILA